MHDGPILLVEDNPDDVLLLRRALRRNNFTNQVVPAADGEEALRRLLPTDDAPPLRPVVILLDLDLPRLTGLEVLRRIRADPRTRTLPVVILTISVLERDIIASYRLGANSVIRKPVAFDDFVETAQVLGGYWLQVNEPPAPGSTG